MAKNSFFNNSKNFFIDLFATTSSYGGVNHINFLSLIMYIGYFICDFIDNFGFVTTILWR